MNPIVSVLKAALENTDAAGFLNAYERALTEGYGDPEITGITQRLAPSMLSAALRKGNVAGQDVLRLWRLINCGRLIVVDNELLTEINARLGNAWESMTGDAGPRPKPLKQFVDDPNPPRTRRKLLGKEPSLGDLEMQRISINSTFVMGMAPVSDLYAYKKNMCASNQEREFLKAARQYFPNLRVYPNVPLRNFFDLDGFVLSLSERHRTYARAAEVDVLLCTDDEDPVAGIELDSQWHDEESRAERDVLKNQLFAAGGIPLVRIRPTDPRAVRAEDFYDLLSANAESLDKLRPRRLRPRRSHDMLVPANVDVRLT